MDKKTNSEIVIEIITKYQKLLLDNGISFERIYLYGSYVEGNPHEESDIDIAIVSEKWLPDIFDAKFELMKLGRKIDTRIEPHPFTRKDFDEGNPYIRQIITYGKLIHPATSLA